MMHKVYQMISCFMSTRNLFFTFSITIVRKSNIQWWINKEHMSLTIPCPFSNLNFTFTNFKWSHFCKSSKLRTTAWSTLQPNDQRLVMICPRKSEPLPQGVVDGCRPIVENVFIAWIGLIEESLPCFFVVEIGGIGDAGLDGMEQDEGDCGHDK